MKNVVENISVGRQEETANTVITVTLIIIVMMKMWFLFPIYIDESLFLVLYVWHIIIMNRQCTMTVYVLLTMIIIWWQRRRWRRRHEGWWTELKRNSIYINLSIFVVSWSFIIPYFSVFFLESDYFNVKRENWYSDRFQEAFYVANIWHRYWCWHIWFEFFAWHTICHILTYFVNESLLVWNVY